jgi:bacteriophage N4 adsorption protein B
MVAGDLIAYLLVTTKMILICACAVFLVSGIDDLFLDICYTVRSVYRRIFILPRFRRLGEDDLLAVPEQPIAVMVPAWDESAVIGPMLANMVRSLNYRNVHIFVGTYPNDPATGEAVDKVQREYPHVHAYCHTARRTD